MKAPVYDFVYPRSLQAGDTVLINDVPRQIVRINANSIRVTVYFMLPRAKSSPRKGDREIGYTYWVSVGEIRAKKVRAS